ncbi:MAG TPA: TIR domain-containing protein [Caulobacteraceae bacterium]|nr:TIR domain-containing protein [Caulobacteraceae bacterium]
MSEIFISYARSRPEGEAKRIADALRALGHKVWRDDELPAHRVFADVLDERLTAAKAVVVLWSAEAVKSQWVRAEAETGRAAGKLVQLSLDGAVPPLPFNQIHCADLAGWSGDPEARGWRQVLDSLAELTAPAEAAPPPPRRARPVSVCVLPFANMSDDPQQTYFSDGISEDIITDLSKVSALSVVARNTAFTFRGSVDIRRVAREVGATHVLEGSVRKAGGRVRITAQLIDGAAGDHVWAERYDRDLDDIFALQDEISLAIVTALRLKLLPEEKQAIERRGTASAEAYDFYKMARQEYVNGVQADPKWGETIARLARRATKIDPHYAEAWALLALGQVGSRYMQGGDEDGMAAAERALELDPGLALAHAVKARVFSDSGRHAEANAEIAEALRLEPGDGVVNYQAGVVFYAQRRLDDAIRSFEAAQALDETDFNSPAFLMALYAHKGDDVAARRAATTTLAHVETVLAHDRNNSEAIVIGARALAVLRRSQQAKEWMERAMLISPDSYTVRFNVAIILASQFNDPEAAVEVLAPALAKMTPNFLEFVRLTEGLQSIREHPRIRAAMAEAEARLGGRTAG